MDAATDKRIQDAWEESKDWITEFDGTPVITLLMNVAPEALAPGLERLVQEGARDLRITRILASNPSAAEFIPPESVPAALAQLQAGDLAELSLNYAIQQEAFDLDIHMIVYDANNHQLALELDWWNDQVFSEETDNPAQFAALMKYFLHLKEVFGAANLFISPESGKDPRGDGDEWVEI